MAEYPKVRFPKERMQQAELLATLEQMKTKDVKWKQGRAFSYVYFADEEILDTVKQAYNLFFSENALNPTAFASLRTMENEAVSMMCDLFHGDSDCCGSMTSGGTESLLMAVKMAREWGRKTKGITEGWEIVMPNTAHPGFYKGCHYFGVKIVLVDVDENYLAIPEAMEAAITDKTVMLVGSAPSYPQGVVDPIEAIGEIASRRNLLCHVDSCIGGMMLPFLVELGYPIPNFDFKVKGVTSISADLHKYGYAAKGASVILYKNAELRKHQYYVYADWSGGIYASPSMMGTRPGGAIAGAWTALKFIGIDGYLEKARIAMDTTKRLQQEIQTYPELKIIGKPDMTIFSIGSDVLDIYELGDEMGLLDWSIDRQQLPPSLHFTITPVHEHIFDDFSADLKASMEKAKKLSMHKFSKRLQVGATKGASRFLPKKMMGKIKDIATKNSKIGEGRSAAMYGMMGALQETGDLEEMVKDFLDKMMRI